MSIRNDTTPTYGTWAYPLVSWDEYDGHPHQDPPWLKKYPHFSGSFDQFWCIQCDVAWRQEHKTRGRCWKCGKFVKRNTYPRGGLLVR